MRVKTFTLRNFKEIIRDPLSLIFGIGLPLVLLGLITLIENSVEENIPIFEIENFAPGIAVFSFSFLSLFLGLLISKDRTNSFLLRIFASPLRAYDYIIGYSLPIIPISIIQSIIFLSTSILLGLTLSINIIWAIIVLIPISLLFIAVGLALGSFFTDKQAGGFFSIFVQIAALSSGMWFDVKMIGGPLEVICNILPFIHAVDATKFALQGDIASVFPHLGIVMIYTVLLFILAIFVFRKKMRS